MHVDNHVVAAAHEPQELTLDCSTRQQRVGAPEISLEVAPRGQESAIWANSHFGDALPDPATLFAQDRHELLRLAGHSFAGRCARRVEPCQWPGEPGQEPGCL